MRVITVARKPLSEANVAANVLKHGCGAMNIDATRIATTHKDGNLQGTAPQPMDWGNPTGHMTSGACGRWPANLILGHLPGCGHLGCTSSCPVAALDEQSGFLHPSGNKGDTGTGPDRDYTASSYHMSFQGRALRDFHDAGGGASRFFKQVK